MALSFTSRITLTSGNNNVRSHGLIGTRRRHFFQRKTSDDLDFVKGAVATTVSLSFVHSAPHKRARRVRVGARNYTCTWARVSERAVRHTLMC